mmetsp:Transcript_107478/g.246065  ORF Transcript_107478/g.246065 Transcript_107478/m.246065 type:complete len:196 (-) Transcript_107478:323-910(-)
MGAGAAKPDKVAFIQEAGRHVFWKDFNAAVTSSTVDTIGWTASSLGSSGDARLAGGSASSLSRTNGLSSESDGGSSGGRSGNGSGTPPVGSTASTHSSTSTDIHRGLLSIGPQSRPHSLSMIDVDSVPPGLSMGSMLHGVSRCAPCAYHHDADHQCRFGVVCEWCHDGSHDRARRPRGGVRVRKKKQARIARICQ